MSYLIGGVLVVRQALGFNIFDEYVSTLTEPLAQDADSYLGVERRFIGHPP